MDFPIGYTDLSNSEPPEFIASHITTDVDVRGGDGKTPLMRVCASNFCSKQKLEWVELILERGADVNAEDENCWTALFFACLDGPGAVCSKLIENGARVNGVDKWRWTPLHVACYHDSHECVDVLLKNSAALAFYLTRNNYTPLIVACENDSKRSAKILIDAGAELNYKIIGENMTALTVATAYHKIGCVELLLQSKADVNARDSNRETVLMRVCRYAEDREKDDLHQKMAVWFISSGCNLDALDGRGWTALMFSATDPRCHSRTRLLLESKATPTLRDFFWGDALMIAAKHKNCEAVRDLLRFPEVRDAINCQDHNDSALKNALQRDNMECVRLLLDAGANVNCSGYFGETALMAAARIGNDEALPLLIRRKANLNLKDAQGYTALQLASYSSNAVDCVRILLKSGASTEDYVRGDQMSDEESDEEDLNHENIDTEECDRLVSTYERIRKWRAAVRVRPWILHWINDHSQRMCAPDTPFSKYAIHMEAGDFECAKIAFYKEYVEQLKGAVSRLVLRYVRSGQGKDPLLLLQNMQYVIEGQDPRRNPGIKRLGLCHFDSYAGMLKSICKTFPGGRDEVSTAYDIAKFRCGIESE
jgi:ankyrin repeat protein